ncbi:endo-alpha-N-acetylgalactosaminidase family protein [Tessaracoccus sp. MC1756]|uniref:endo-alpha-N-acetylgalactosaminidase family protein n=1 Tax=Tessaracoccus sp. MC1756 TaxID=2760311 RepID=UPI001C722306|nr:endo-alpha-N-acetylgalactosaminidase family protein [Tessaracoccus sp. MC1756]
MSTVTTRHVVAGIAAGALAFGGLVFPQAATAAYEYTAIPQSEMTVVDVNSVETTGEGTNGAAALVLDGNPETYWHTQWSGTTVQPPHHLTVKVADTPVQLGRVRLTPRQSSNGSGRVNEYELWTSASACTTDTTDFVKRAEGSFDGLVVNNKIEREITFPPVDATCVKVVYLSTWGGHTSGEEISRVEKVGSLAEFNADTATGDGPTVSPTPTEPTVPPVTEIVIPEGTIELADGDLKVRLHPDFPQVVDYRLGDDQLAGRIGAALTTILVNEVEQPVTVADPVRAADGRSASYALTFPNLTGVSMTARIEVADEALRFTLTDIVDPDGDVNRVRIPNHNLVTVTGNDAQLTAGLIGVNRNVSGDRFEPLATTSAGAIQGSWMAIANDSNLAATLDSNATEDNRGPASTSGRVAVGNNRLQRQITTVGGVKLGALWSGTWTWLGEPVEQHEGVIGRDADPYVTVKLTRDRNADSVIDWQDGAIAHREIVESPLGADNVKNEVVARIPFNIVSQATHPFLRTLDDTKRISLETDNLGQRVLLKGYQSEGHDAAHPDYAGHYNQRAGGFEDLETLTETGADYNAKFGVHVNATESYSEAYSFSEDLLQMPPKKAWGWMNQSYYIDGPKDLATGAVLDRFQDFYDEKPANLTWLYVDVYYPYGWEMERFASELADMGWELSSEWSDRFPNQTLWSHWSQDENYGGAENKGLNSTLMRFTFNHERDTWNPHPILSNSNVVEFEGWSGGNNHNAFLRNVWERNLPAKFLQQSPILKWETNRIAFTNGTVATSPLTSIPGSTVPTNREITFDGATVFADGGYLLPWQNGGENRLYHYKIGGGTTEWTLTDAFAGQTSLKLFKLTDTGREPLADVPVVDGKISLTAEANTAYVLYPTTTVPQVQDPNWGEGSNIEDPGFFSGTLEAYETTGNVTVERNARRNYEAQIGAGEASLSQALNLPAGTYSAWASVEIEPGKTRDLTIEASGTGVTAAGYAETDGGKVVNTIAASTVRNSTASDQKRDFYHQRHRVTFTTPGGDVTLAFKAGDGDARILIDDLRVVEFLAPVDPDSSELPDTVFFEDFENIDTGYYPFVTGATNRGGDARTQLARLHAPYSQKGWWGVDSTNNVVEGGKLNDNVLRGDWSLMANNENSGEILKTAPGAIAFEAGQRYRVSFDYQTTYADQYRVRIGSDVVTATGVRTVNAVSDVLGEQRDTTTYSAELDTACGANAFVAIDKLAGANTQHNMTIDDLRVEHLGEAESGACIEGSMSVTGTAQAGRELTVTTRVVSVLGAGTDVKHELTAPEGWTTTVTTAGATELAEGATSTQVWKVLLPEGVEDAVLQFRGSMTQGQETAIVERSANVTVIPPLPGGQVYLSDMRERIVGTPTNGWGPVEWDLSNGEQGGGDGGPLKIDGVTYPKGIGMHAPASVTFNLEGECQAFSSFIGIDDVQTGRGTVQFVVIGDGEELFRSETLRHDSAVVEIKDLDITGVQELTLKAETTADGNGNDHADWAEARVTCNTVEDVTGPVVDTITAPADAQVGKALSIAVTATDVSTPLTYAATGLPAGVTINAGTGVISGTPTADGTFSVTVTVTDAKGNETDSTFTLVVAKKAAPTVSPSPSVSPSVKPSVTPSVKPSVKPSVTPSGKPTTTPASDKFVPTVPYTLPGRHDFNGRQWFTTCEAYSQTERCRTEIWATVVKVEDGKFVRESGWAFNNLTYLPYMTRQAWKGNPLGQAGEFTSARRQWKTECDTAATGRGACRSYTMTTVYAATAKPAGGYTFSQSNEWVFNNIVMFGGPEKRG